jgi:hypothetical protein
MDLIRSKPELDLTAESSVGHGHARGAEASNDLVHTHFTFENYRGDPPHARVSLDWTDVEAVVDAFAKKGHSGALRVQRAEKLAAAVDEFAKNSN